MTLPIFSFFTTADEVASTFASRIQGKNVLITGTSLNGIGFETARVIANHANLVIITGYNSQRLKLSEDAIRKNVPSATVRRLLLDLSSLVAIRQAASEVNAYSEPLHVLIHNAAAVTGPFKRTVDHLESQIAIDHIGPFLFTKLLMPKLLAGMTSTYIPRVVFVSSEAQGFGSGVNFNTIMRPDAETYSSVDAYCQAKSANVLTAIELSKRSKGTINAYSVHPGVIYTNMYQKPESIADIQAEGHLDCDGRPSPHLPWKTLAQGAATTVTAAFDPRLDDVPGAYLSDCAEANMDLAPHSCDPANAEKLWAITEEILDEVFTFEE
ncbi:hypothetical protein C8J57DRAFT_1396944 [Mycena rebaudengoi]|nr:hypothetical protein C8J57DRAFT_1396944 [Mycena rebaudengoi]